MAKKPFKPIYGSLEKLTEQERADYVARACDFLDIPNDLNLIELIWLDSGDAARSLLLYVKRGGTDLIRGKRGINVVSLDPMHGDGFVAFAATGKDSSGRQEMSIGSASTKGLTGQAVATSLMLAQTRALRRLTLQFIGGGFLDESEVTSEKTSNIASAAQPLAQIAQPAVSVNSAAGKDITAIAVQAKADDNYQFPPAPQPPAPIPLPKPEPLNSAVGAITFSGGSPSVEEPRKSRRGRPRKIVSLDAPGTEAPIGGDQLVGKMCSYKEVSPSNFVPHAEDPTPSELLQAQPDIYRTMAGFPGALEAVSKLTSEQINNLVTTPIEIVPAKEEKSSGTPCTEEQKKEYRAKLSKYTNELLPAAGFLQSEKSGSRLSKMKMFMTALIPGVVTSSPSAEDWQTLFDYLDEKIETIGAAELVKLIDKTIGDE